MIIAGRVTLAPDPTPAYFVAVNRPADLDQFGAPMRELRIRVPDVNTAEYRAALASQIDRINASEDGREVMIWIEEHIAEIWRELD